MHRETNLQVENEETIEAQSARTPKRCWTESNSAFSFACTDSLDGAPARAIIPSPACIRTASLPRFAPSLRFSCSGCSFADSAPLRACCPGLPGWRARNASVTLSFRRPRGRENGRQFSYKQNAEEGVRLDEQRRTMVRGRRGGGCRSFVAGKGDGHRGFPELFSGLYARSGAIAGRCVRIRTRCLMSRRLSDVSPLVHPVASGRIGVRSRYRCARIDLPPDPAFLRLLHRDDIAVAHRDGRTTVPAGMRRLGAAFHGKTSMGAAGLDN
ncbi:hypothetical protein BCO18175_05360 [Burkholderia contaminans]|nr:hypothetical protein BCO18175_05360 [Burkholderia contaminans]